jgi:hypothetical protein
MHEGYREKVTAARRRTAQGPATGYVVRATRIDRLARRPSTCSPSSSASSTQSTIPLTGGAVGRRRRPQRAADDCRLGQTGGRRARPYPHSHRRGLQPGAEARAAHWPGAAIAQRAKAEGRRARRLRNSRAATAWGRVRFPGSQP